MKSSHWTVVLLLLGLVVGVAVGGGVTERKATAQEKPPGGSVSMLPTPGRFQISAWGYAVVQTAGPAKSEHGCYIVDTVTGELWQVDTAGQRQKIGDKLR